MHGCKNDVCLFSTPTVGCFCWLVSSVATTTTSLANYHPATPIRGETMAVRRGVIKPAIDWTMDFSAASTRQVVIWRGKKSVIGPVINGTWHGRRAPNSALRLKPRRNFVAQLTPKWRSPFWDAIALSQVNRSLSTSRSKVRHGTILISTK